MTTSKRKKVIVPILIFIGTVLLAILIGSLKKQPDPQVNKPVLPKVQTFTAIAQSTQLALNSQGIISPTTETRLYPEVSGRIDWISDQFRNGGFFKKGEPLIKIESLDYELALAEAKAALSQANYTYAQELASAEQAQTDWASLNRQGTPSDLVLRIPQLNLAKDNLSAAQARLTVAERNLERTTITAPYDGLVLNESIDFGQVVNARSTLLGTIQATDSVEVRLSLNRSEITFIDDVFSPELPDDKKPKVILSPYSDIHSTEWHGFIHRIEANVDPESRLYHVVARINDPYNQNKNTFASPLKVGQFVEASILGETLEEAFIIPRSALQGDDHVYLIDESNRLQKTKVTIAQTNSDKAIVVGGLKNGDRLCLTPLLFFIEGMEVNPVEENQ